MNAMRFSRLAVAQGLDLSTAFWGAYGMRLYERTAEELCRNQSANVYFKNLTPSPNGCVTLMAVWTAIPYDIAYNLNGGVNAMGNPSRFTVLDLPIRMGEPTREGYRFLGWSPNGGVISAKVTGVVVNGTGYGVVTVKKAKIGELTVE